MTPLRYIFLDLFSRADAALALAGFRTPRAVLDQVWFENLEDTEARVYELVNEMLQDRLREMGYGA